MPASAKKLASAKSGAHSRRYPRFAVDVRMQVRMFQDGYASPADIDTAMMLGCGYPRGPFQMLDEAGAANVVGVLDAMHAATGDPAFTPVPLLAEYATAGSRFRAGAAG